MAQSNVDETRLDYRRLFWGEMIEGTKAQLQALGLGVGRPFPGEEGGSKRSMAIVDPRGLAGRIELDDGLYKARIKYPWLPKNPSTDQGVPFAPGVERFNNGAYDCFVGKPEALAGAGIVAIEHLPGQPGMRKHRVTIHADGTLPTGAHTTPNPRAYEPGAKHIVRSTAGRYQVMVNLYPDEQHRLQVLHERQRDDYIAACERIAPPAMLGTSHDDRAAHSVSTPVYAGGAIDALRSMSVLHRRSLPPGWRVIAGGAQ